MLEAWLSFILSLSAAGWQHSCYKTQRNVHTTAVHTTPLHCTALYCAEPYRHLSSSQLQRKNVDTSIPPHTSRPRPPSNTHHLNILFALSIASHSYYFYQGDRSLFSDVISSDMACLDTFVFYNVTSFIKLNNQKGFYHFTSFSSHGSQLTTMNVQYCKNPTKSTDFEETCMVWK